MLNDPGAVEVLLRDSVLADRPVRTIPVPGGAEPALAVRCAPDELLTAWRSARAILNQTGRWPVVCVGWDGPLGVELFNRFPYDYGAGEDTSVAGIVARADTVDAGEVIGRLALDDDALDVSDQLESFELPATRQWVGEAPSPEEVHEALGSHLAHGRLDRWLLNWEEERGLRQLEPPTHLEWFDPSGMDVAVVLLPTVDGWHTPAYMSFFGAEGPGGAEKLIAVLREWSHRYGAELVAHFGTMLEFVVTRPPATLEEAWRLAREHELIAPCTTLLPGVPLRWHSRALIGRPTWFLHERP